MPSRVCLCRSRYEHFNPIQTQLFHVLYHSDESVLLGAPTGSGKTAVAEIAIMRMLNEHPGAKVRHGVQQRAVVLRVSWRWKTVDAVNKSTRM